MTDETMKPKVVAVKVRTLPNCIFHRVRQPIRKFLIEDKKTNEKISYGLCKPCNSEFNRRKDFKQKINDRLIELFDEKQEGSNG